MNSNEEYGLVELVNMEFYSYHGCFREENIIGNKFLVNFSAKTDLLTPGVSDSLSDALNYQELYSVIKREMDVTSNLLESVALRILNKTANAFPAIIWAKVSVEKLNPPVGGKVGSSRVVMSKNFKK